MSDISFSEPDEVLDLPEGEDIGEIADDEAPDIDEADLLPEIESEG